MIVTQDRPAPSWFTRRHRRPAIVATAALAIVVTMGGAAHASDSSTQASSVAGALVEIVSTEAYAGATAAGTGMILTSNGEILTNNHVIDGATSIEVTVASSGATYSASVVGTSPTQDVAVIQLKNASGLKTVPLATGTVKVGQSVVASGNAGGTGQISTVTGSVTALDQAITASSDDGSAAENLTGLIETSAPIVAGDSGGALATTSGKVIGMNTAASVSNSTDAMNSSYSSAASQAYAIPIGTALKVANQIESGDASSTIHLGLHGFLGVQLATSTSGQQGYGYGGYGGFGGYGGGYSGGYSGGYGSSSTPTGATLGGVVSSGPAAAAGLQAGDTITSVDGTAIDSTTTLNTIMESTKPGQKVTVGWTTAAGQTQTATLTLGTAAAD